MKSDRGKSHGYLDWEGQFGELRTRLWWEVLSPDTVLLTMTDGASDRNTYMELSLGELDELIDALTMLIVNREACDD